MEQPIFNNEMRMDNNQMRNMDFEQDNFQMNNRYKKGTSLSNMMAKDLQYHTEDKELDMRNLVNKIDTKIDNTLNKIDDDIFDDEKILKVEDKEKESSWMSIFSMLTLKDLVLLIVIYIIMSLSFVQRFISGYIPYIQPEENGMIPTSGIIIYGIFFAVLYLISRKVMLKY